MTFKANWEQTHTQVQLSDELIMQLLGTYYTDASDINSFAIIEGGCANINIKVNLNSTEHPVILRVYLREPESAYKEQKLAALLGDKVPAPQFFHVAEAFGYTFAIVEYLPGITLRELLLNGKDVEINNIMFEVGAALGTIAAITFPSAGFFNKKLEVTDKISGKELINFCEQMLADPKVQALIPDHQRTHIAEVFSSNIAAFPDGNEANLVHADFDPANILVISENGHVKISGILDWEFAFSGSTLFDVANMLRYAHQMPADYQDAFLAGLQSTGYQLPDDWAITVKLLNIIALMDCLQRSDPNKSPNRVNDIKALISHILNSSRKVTVVAYDPNWQQKFNDEAALLKEALGPNVIVIHHIGSTSIPGLTAKPIIDIIPVVADIQKVDEFDSQMHQLGYEIKGEFGILFRRFFQKEGFNVHVFEEGNPEIKRHLAFRDWLINHPEDKAQYQALKQELADKFPHDIYSYCIGKDELVGQIDQKAGFNSLRIVEALTPSQWLFAKTMRNKYFFEPNNIEDLYTWTFEYSDHKHFILYQGIEIVGYAHIQLWPEQRAAIRIIVVDESYQGQGCGKNFLKLIEKWLKTQEYISIHTESTAAAIEFYKHAGYQEMPFNDPDGYEGGPDDIAMGKML